MRQSLWQSKVGDDVSQPEAVPHKRVAQPVWTARGSHPQHLQHQLMGHKECYSRCVRRCGCCFRDAVFVQPAHLVSVPGKRLVSRRISHSIARPGAHLQYTSSPPIHPSLQMHLSSPRHGPSAAIANFAVQRASAACWRGSFQR